MPKVKSLIYKENVIQPCYSIAILRKFDNYNPTFYNTDLITIWPVSFASSAVENCEVLWKLSWCVTINKSHWLTKQKTIADLANTEKGKGLVYEALWKVKNLSDFMVELIIQILWVNKSLLKGCETLKSQ